MVLDELFVTKQHSIFAVNRHDKFWTSGFGHDANVFLRSMTTHVNQAALLFNDVCAFLIDKTNEFRDRTFVARNDAR